ncbi:MAG: site-2 protease family protein [Planctomycetales bacterium]|nr:site-2 protease family protein [Planctomycetales bacterium]
MNGNLSGSWSLSLGRWQGCEVRLHIHFPLLALAALLYGNLTDAYTPGDALLAMGVLLASVGVHELVRLAAAARVGGRTHLVVLAPCGGLTQPRLPADPPAHLVAALAGPTAYLSLVVAAACVLAAAGEVQILGLLNLFAPHFIETQSNMHMALQLAVWINSWLLAVNLLPAPPLDGAELLRSMVWPLTGRSSATAVTAHIALGAAAVTAFLSVVLRHMTLGETMPAWFPLSVLSIVLLYGGNRMSRQRRYDLGLDIEQFEVEETLWVQAAPPEEEGEVVLVEHIQQRQQEALDRKRRERETIEDAEVDAILSRLSATSFDQLSAEEQAILKRASRRYRERRGEG